ncbi:hypothetical protein SteCoe_34627 [Stentor coeruleus]|uniref:Uncharacterized protein n=1 Tax=Stentor coeruleus TaxID=5963 RepID=A0A1R2AU53_9CILI|nr:hypothetical protein SteCoe_34627 [Stentor coeruleus]
MEPNTQSLPKTHIKKPHTSLHSRSNCPIPLRINTKKKLSSLKSCNPSISQSKDLTGFYIPNKTSFDIPLPIEINQKYKNSNLIHQETQLSKSPKDLNKNPHKNKNSIDYVMFNDIENTQAKRKKDHQVKRSYKSMSTSKFDITLWKTSNNSTNIKLANRVPTSFDFSGKFNYDLSRKNSLPISEKMSIDSRKHRDDVFPKIISWDESEENSPTSPVRLHKKSIDNRPTLCPTEEVDHLQVVENHFDSQIDSPRSPCNNLPSIRESINQNLKLHTKCQIIDFFTVLSYYNQLQLSSHKHGLIWKTSCFEKIFKCFYNYTEIDEHNIEICEKLISFAYTQFSFNDNLHKSLLVSVYARIKRIDNIPDDPEDLFTEIIHSNKENFHLDTKMPLLGLTNVLFLDSYFPELLEKIIEICEVCEVNTLDVVFKVTKINVEFLRKRKFNGLINRGRRCLELIFFMFAGLMVCFYSIFQNENNTKKVCREIIKQSKDNLQEVLDVARDAYANQATQN